MGTPWVVGCVWLLLDPLIPVITVSVQVSNTVAIDAHIITGEHKGGRLILIANWQRMFEPI